MKAADRRAGVNAKKEGVCTSTDGHNRENYIKQQHLEQGFPLEILTILDRNSSWDSKTYETSA